MILVFPLIIFLYQNWSRYLVLNSISDKRTTIIKEKIDTNIAISVFDQLRLLFTGIN